MNLQITALRKLCQNTGSLTRIFLGFYTSILAYLKQCYFSYLLQTINSFRAIFLLISVLFTETKFTEVLWNSFSEKQYFFI